MITVGELASLKTTTRQKIFYCDTYSKTSRFLIQLEFKLFDFLAPIGRKLAEICRTRYNRLDESETQPQAVPSSYEEISADS